MSAAFDRLHPALQHHIVNSLGFRALRPLQEAAIEPVLGGEHALLVAPTAGGKTEAAVFPVLSRMLAEDWRGISIVYVCPIKALLNNLETRLARYGALIGRRVALWHGDVGEGERRRVVADPPDLLLTTPESLEAMLLFRRDERGALFSRLRVVVVDELHAFAGDDRGWHLLSVLARLQRVAGRELQRIGLSATIGNPDALIAWLAAGCAAPRRVVSPPAGALPPPDLQLDHVGSLENAALVISRLHRGEKRLVFVDSRSRVEALAVALRAREVSTFVSHSSLSLDERRRAEEAFAGAGDCVIVATSTLELGVDVGDLDRVILVDAPWSVASVLQRVGRTGRRPGTRRNGLFLTTSDDAFLRAAGLLELIAQGYVEPVEPPPLPLHVFAQQILALVMQEGRVPEGEWRLWIGAVPAFADLPAETTTEILEHMVANQYLAREAGMLSLGPAAEERFKGMKVMDLCSVFSSPPLFKVLHGREELGEVHESTFQRAADGQRPALSLGGRSWQVTDLNWGRRVAYVVPSDERGRSRWVGGGQHMHFRLARAIRTVLAGTGANLPVTKRGSAELAEVRADHAVRDDEGILLRTEPSGCLAWWTFAGGKANHTLAHLLSAVAPQEPTADNLCIRLDGGAVVASIQARIDEMRAQPGCWSDASVGDEALRSVKFVDCLPHERAASVLRARVSDPLGVGVALGTAQDSTVGSREADHV